MNQQQMFDFGWALFLAMGGPVLVCNGLIAILRWRGLNNAADWVVVKSPLVLAVLARNPAKQADIARGVAALKGSTRIEARIAGQLLETHLPPASTDVTKKDPSAPVIVIAPPLDPPPTSPPHLGGGQ